MQVWSSAIVLNKIRSHQQLLHIIIVILSSFIVYFNSLTGDFILDDWPIIVNNPKVRSFEYIVDYFTSGVWTNSGLLSETDAFLYRPFFLLFVNFVYQGFGPNAIVFHSFCLIFHMANSVLVYFTLKSVLRDINPGLLFFGALVFAVHPIHTESVSWISGVTDPMVTFYILLSFMFFIYYQRQPSPLYIVGSMICFIFALLSKEVAVVLPILIGIYSYLSGKKLFSKVTVAFFLILGLYFIIRTFALGKTVEVSAYEYSGWVNFIDFIAEYIKLLWVAWPIQIYFSVPDQGVAGYLAYLLSAFSIGILTYALLVSKNTKILWFGVSWFCMTLLPGLSLAFLSSPMFAIRFLYLPSIGFVMVLLWFLSHLKFKNKLELALIASSALCILLFYSITTISLNRNWNDEEVFYRKILNLSPTHEGALSKLAQYYQRKGLDDQAIPVFIQAAKHGGVKTKIVAFESIGLIYGTRGNTQQSIEYYSKALALDPNRSSVLVGLGNNALQQKQYTKALHFYQRAYSENNKNYGAVYNLSLVYQILGDTDKALYYRNLAEQMPQGWVY